MVVAVISPMISKITGPKLKRVMIRHRLFRLLDQAEHASAIWLAGSAGSGKTSLMASYLCQNNTPSIWYKIDPGDKDPATFFYYLGQAAKPASVSCEPAIPQFAPEYLSGIDTFAAHYFETLYQRLTAPIWLVFDNFQEAPADSPMQTILKQAIEQVHANIKVVVISRNEPPKRLARLIANRDIALTGGAQLAFRIDELNELVRLLYERPVAFNIAKLQQMTRGWIAGIILWLMNFDMGAISKKMPLEETPEAIFDYFGSEILSRIDASTKDFLFKTSFLGDFDAETADQMTGLENAADIIEKLSRRNFFLEKRGTDNTAYQYHPLFLEFLQRQAHRYYSRDKLNALCCHAASIAAAAGNTAYAVGMYYRASAWEPLVELIQAQAPMLYFQGRLETLYLWLKDFPTQQVHRYPWLLLWKGVSLLPADPKTGRQFVADAYELFSNDHDLLGRVLSLAAAVESYFILRSDMRGLDVWIAEGEMINPSMDDMGDLNIYGRFAAAMLGAMTIRSPAHPRIDFWIERSTTLMNQGLDTNLHITLGNFLVLIHCWHGHIDKAHITLRKLRHAYENSLLPPLQQILFKVMQCVYCQASGESERCLQVAKEAWAISQETGVHVYDGLICSHGAYGALVTADLAEARRHLNQMAKTIQPHEAVDLAHYHALCAWEAFALGKLSLARAQIQTARTIGEANGAPILTIISGRLFEARLALAADEADCAKSHLASIKGRARAEGCTLVEFQQYLTQAAFAFHHGQSRKWNFYLEKAFGLSRERNILDGNWWLHSQLAFFCQKALSAGIETEQVRRFIRCHRLTPENPRSVGPYWPWPVRIHLLGRLEVVCARKPMELSAKTPKKPLELLKVLISQSVNGISRERAADHLWPDTDGDRASQNINTNLHRLRKLLGPSQAIQLEKGCLRLNPSQCWIDAWYFEALTEKVKATSDDDAKQALLTKVLNLYQGHLDETDAENPLVVGYAQKLRSLWMRSVVALTGLLAANGKWEQSQEVLLKALNLDDAAEPLYQRLMSLLYDQGRISEALFTFNRMHRVLTRQGLFPSPDTMALHEKIQLKRRQKRS